MASPFYSRLASSSVRECAASRTLFRSTFIEHPASFICPSKSVSARERPGFSTAVRLFHRLPTSAPPHRGKLPTPHASLESQEFEDEDEEEEEENDEGTDEDDWDSDISVGIIAEVDEDESEASHALEHSDAQGSDSGDDGKKAEEYSATMQVAMGNASLVYRHELGMNYARVLPDLIVGSCLQSVEDVDTLRDKENVGSVLCLQQDSDLEYFGLDLNPIISRTLERGDIQHIRSEIRDFDPFSLRLELPLAVAKLHKANRERGTAYVHCTAGLGRAPAVALAYMWWLRDFTRLEDANEVLQAVRPCGPKLFAIRAALCDVLTGSPKEPLTVVWRSRGVMPRTVEVAGLDVGWHNRLPLERSSSSKFWTVTRELPVGTYYFKFIIDGDKWSYSADGPLTAPDRDNNVNNYAEVQGLSLSPEAIALRKRLMVDGTPLEAEERALVVSRLNELADAL